MFRFGSKSKKKKDEGGSPPVVTFEDAEIDQLPPLTRPPGSNEEQARPLNVNQVTPIISSLLSCSEVISLLEEQGCENISSRLNPNTFSQYPVSAGGFGDIYSGQLDNVKVAIKTVRPYTGSGVPAGKYLKRSAKELYTWSRCKHPNVARLLGLTEFRGCLAMISDWAENGNLPAYLVNNPSINRLSLSASICEGLVYLHESNIVHGDLKGINVLVSGNGTPMLTDFGNASFGDSALAFTATATTNFSIRWAAPEIIEETSSQSRGGDVYALGMTILETITGQIPFSTVRQDFRIARIVVDKKETPPRPQEIPTSAWGDTLWDFLMNCWAFEPESRPSAVQVRDMMKVLSPGTLAPPTPIVVSSLLSTSEVISILEKQGCANLTSSLDLQTCPQHPVRRGGFGDVYVGWLRSGAKVAIKTLRPYEDNLPAGKYRKRLARELYTWSKCDHPNVAKPLGLAEFRGGLAMISEWAEHGDIISYLKKNPAVDKYSLVASICEGLAYLHENNIVHGGIKAANILVSGNGIPMLTDFGSASLGSSTVSFTETAYNTISLRWAAPEILEGYSSPSRAGDIYALGMTILEIVTGKLPFGNLKEISVSRTVVDKRGTPTRPEDQIPTRSAWGNILWALLMNCWAYEPVLRPSAAQVRDHMRLYTPEMLAPIETEASIED